MSTNTTAASQSTSFYSSFSSHLNSISQQLVKAKSSSDFDAALQAIVDARATLQEKDSEGLLTKRDNEQYQKRLTSLQQEINLARASNAQPTFSFRRPAKTTASTSIPATQPVLSTSTSKMSSSESSGQNGVQITLQSKRYLTFDNLPNAATNDGLSLTLAHLSECIVDFRKAPVSILAISANNLKGCALLLPKVQGSVMLSGLDGSVVFIEGCGQFRMYGSTRTTIFLNTTSAATIEACEALSLAALDPSDQLQVQDFDAPGSATPSKSWKQATDQERSSLISRVDQVLSKAQSASASPESWTSDLAVLQGPPEKFREEEAGILLVFSDPGTTSTLEEFQDWYDNEHVPIRVLDFDEFRSAGRYEVYESKHTKSDVPTFKAGWSASYTIATNTLYRNDAYVALRSHRSPREAELVARLGVLDRRILTLVSDSASTKPKGDLRPRTKAETEQELASEEFLGFNYNNAPDTEVQKWFEEKYKGEISQLSGFTRTRLVKMVDAVINGKQVTKDNADAKDCATWAVVTHFSSSAVPKGTEDVKALGEVGIVEVRKSKLYKAWDCTKALENAKKGGQ